MDHNAIPPRGGRRPSESGDVVIAGAGVTGTETALFELMKDASRDHFKEFIQLVK